MQHCWNIILGKWKVGMGEAFHKQMIIYFKKSVHMFVQRKCGVCRISYCRYIKGRNMGMKKVLSVLPVGQVETKLV